MLCVEASAMSILSTENIMTRIWYKLCQIESWGFGDNKTICRGGENLVFQDLSHCVATIVIHDNKGSIGSLKEPEDIFGQGINQRRKQQQNVF